MIIIIIIIVVVIIHNFNPPRERVIVADSDVMSTHGISQFQVYMLIEGSGGGGGELGLIFAGYVPLALRAPTPF